MKVLDKGIKKLKKVTPPTERGDLEGAYDRKKYFIQIPVSCLCTVNGRTK
jgi:hypothetical protein